MYNNKMLVSTFSGQSCYFGTGSVNDGWNVAVKNWLPPVHFIPAFFIDPATFASLQVVDGAFNVRPYGTRLKTLIDFFVSI